MISVFFPFFLLRRRRDLPAAACPVSATVSALLPLQAPGAPTNVGALIWQDGYKATLLWPLGGNNVDGFKIYDDSNNLVTTINSPDIGWKAEKVKAEKVTST